MVSAVCVHLSLAISLGMSGAFNGDALQPSSVQMQQALPQQELEAIFTEVFKLTQTRRGSLNMASGSLGASNFAEAQALLAVLWTV